MRLYVNSTAATYYIKVYRVGWYQGHGARLMYTSTTYPGRKQPDPLFDRTTRTVSASNWTDPVTIDVPRDWVSGVYIVKMTSSEAYSRYTLFVVRNDSANSPYLVQTSILTYQAYNGWHGFSLYRGTSADGKLTSADRSYVVSFDRPYHDNAGLMDFPLYEYSFIRWFERSGFNGSYSTDIDAHLRGQALRNHGVIVFAGHDEYWSTAMRANVSAARDAGISLAFYTANNIYWHVRLQDSPLGPARLVVCYREDTLDPIVKTNPKEATVRWRDAPLNAPESTLIGQQYSGIVSTTSSLILDTGSIPYLAGTTLQAGQVLAGLIGGEYDKAVDDGPFSNTREILTTSPVTCAPSPLCPANGQDYTNAIIYTTPGGARVFDAGTFYWSWGLDDDHILSSVLDHAFSTPDFRRYNVAILTSLLLKHVPASG